MEILRRPVFILLLLTIAAVAISRYCLCTAMPASLRLIKEGSGGDYRHHYLPVAQHLADGDGLCDPKDGHLDTWFPPGYAFWLAGLLRLNAHLGMPFESFRSFACNGLLVPLTALGLYVAWKLMGLSSGWAISAAIAYIVHPIYVWASITPLSECLFTLLLVWTCVAWAMAEYQPDDFRWYGSIGAGLGLCMLVRPIAMLLPLMIAVVMLWRGRQWKLVLGMVLCTILVVAPWSAYASLTTGEFVGLSCNGMFTVKYGLVNYYPDNPVTRALQADTGAQRHFCRFIPFVIEQFFENPGASIRLWSQKFLRPWYGTASQTAIEVGLAAMNFSMLAAAAVGVVLTKPGKKLGANSAITFNLICLLLYFWMIAALTGTLLRYMVPVLWVPVGGSILLLRWATERSASKKETRLQSNQRSDDTAQRS